jgi:hypothetical protein
MRALLILPILLTSFAFADEPQQGAAGTASGSDNQVFNLILTPGQTADVKIEAKENDVILATVSSNAFDPAVGLYTKDGKKIVENDDIKEGDQSGQIIYRIKEAGEYKLVVTGFKGAAGGPFALNLRRFNAPLMSGTTLSSDFREEGADWRAIQIQKDVPTVIAIQGSRNQIPTGYDANGNVLPQTDSFAFPLGGRFTFTSPTDQEIYIYIPRSGYKNFTIDALPVKFDSIIEGSPEKGELPRSQAISYRFTAKAGDLYRTLAGPGRAGFQTTIRPVKLENKNPQQPLTELPNLSKTPNAFTFFIREPGEYEVIIAHSGFRSTPYTLSLTDFAQDWAKDSISQILPIGENYYYKWDLPIGVLIDLSAESEVFDLNFSLLSPKGLQIANEDDNGESTNPKYQMLVTQPGTYYLRVGSVGDGGGGKFTLNRKITSPDKFQSGKTIQAKSDKPALQLFEAKKGQFFYLAIEKNHDVSLALYSPDGQPAEYSSIKEPSGRVIIMINPGQDGNYLLVIKTNDPETEVKLSSIKVGQ